jgi:hypothetical protein
MQWEHLVVDLHRIEYDARGKPVPLYAFDPHTCAADALTQYGAQGFELVSVVDRGERGVVLYMKRPTDKEVR